MKRAESMDGVARSMRRNNDDIKTEKKTPVRKAPEGAIKGAVRGVAGAALTSAVKSAADSARRANTVRQYEQAFKEYQQRQKNKK